MAAKQVPMNVPRNSLDKASTIDVLVVAALADLQAEVLGGPGLYWVRRRLSLRPPTTPSQVLTWGPDLGRLPPGDLRDLVALASGTVALGLRESLYDLVPAECLDALRQKKMREVAE